MTKARLILAVVSTTLEEVAIWVIWRWGLPELGLYLPVSALIGVMAGWGVFAAVNFTLVTRALGKRIVVGLSTMIGSRGKVTGALEPEGMVRIKGELWSATTDEGRSIGKGEEIIVVGEEGLKLVVRRSDREK